MEKKKITEEKRNVCEREKEEERKQTRSIIHSFIHSPGNRRKSKKKKPRKRAKSIFALYLLPYHPQQLAS
jgi:hypothetical protein